MSITPRDPADFTPTRGTYTELKPFRFWCQKVLPLVYDDTLSYYELLCKVVDYLNKTMEDVETLEDDVTNIYTAYNELQEYVNTYFSSLDVQEEINNKLDEMASDGSLTALISPLLPELIGDWLEENLSPTTPPVDKTLTIENAAADAKTVGDAIRYMLKPFQSNISSTYITNNPTFADIRNWESGYVYNVSSSAIASMSNIPAGLTGNCTIAKFNGSNRNTGGWSLYIITSIDNSLGCAFTGFDSGSLIYWNKLSDDELFKVSDTLLNDAFATANPNTTIINLPLNRLYRGGMTNNYQSFGLPDNKSFTLLALNPFGTNISTSNPNQGFSIYLYFSYESSAKRPMYYCYKSANESASDLKWVRMLNEADTQYDVKPFDSNISSTFIENNPTYADVRNWESGYIYNVSSSAISALTNIPGDLTGNCTITKLNGNHRDTGGWCEYVIVSLENSLSCLYTGFDSGSNVRWNKLSDDGLIKVSDTVLNEAYYTAHPNETIINVPLNRIYRGQMATHYNEFGLPDGNSFTMMCFSPYGSAIAATNPNQGFAIYFYCSWLSSRVKQMYYCFKSVNDTVGENLRWIKLNSDFRKYLFIGDSYGEGFTHDGNNSGWITYCTNFMGLDSREFTKVYSGGAGFVNSSNNFKDMLGDYSMYNFTDIVVCGGFNDNAYTAEQIINGINSFVNTARTKYPYAKVHIGFIGYIKQGSGTGALENWETVKSNLINIVLPAYQKGVTKKAQYLNNIEYWINDAGLSTSDGYHPNADGNQNLGMAIANALLTGSAPLPYNSDLRL